MTTGSFATACVAAVLWCGCAGAQATADPAADKAVREQVARFATAYEAGDAKAIAALFTPEARVIDEDGGVIEGREAIARRFEDLFAEQPGAMFAARVESIRFPGPDTAIEEGTATITPKSGPPEVGAYSVVHVRPDGQWLQAEVRELGQKGLTPHDRLKPLEWLVGEWVSESDEDRVEASCRWSPDGNYLLRDFEVRIRGRRNLTGTQRIGWDPLTRRIKSWAFDDKGAHGEAYWTPDGERWVVKSTGALPDGEALSATQVITRIGKDRVSWSTVDRVVGELVLPDPDDVVLVRRPPQPSAKR